MLTYLGLSAVVVFIAALVLLQSASDDFLARTILFGRPDTPMPAFRREGAQGLSDEEVRDLIAYVRSLGKKGSNP